MTYMPPFISERMGEVRFNGCTFRSSLMAFASATYGEIIQNSDHEPMGAKAIHALAEALEPGPPTQAQGFNPIDVLRAVQKRDPDFPEVASWDNARAWIRLKWPEYQRRIQSGEVSCLQGNAIRVKDRGSPLHRFVGDVGHAIAVLDGGKDAGFVMDPMGLPVDSYKGQWVPWKDLEEFASEYVKQYGYVFCSLVKTGSLTRAAIVQRKLDTVQTNLKGQINGLKGDLDIAKTRLTDARAKAEADAQAAAAALSAAIAERDAVTARLAEAQAAVVPLQTQVDDLTMKLAAATDGTAIADLQAQLDTASSNLKAAWNTITSDVSTIEALNTEVADLEAQLEQCNGSIPQPGDTDGLIAFLRRFLRRTPK